MEIRRPVVITWTVGACILLVGVVVLIDSTGSHSARGFQPANPAPAAGLYVAPDGLDSGRCGAAQPCASLAYADRVAAPGDVVEVAAGSYPAQVLERRHVVDGPAPVVFRPEPGAKVELEYVEIAGSGIELRDVVTGGWVVGPGASDVTFRDIESRGAVFITSADRVRVLGGSVGPGDSRDSQIKAADTEGAPVPRDILIDGVDFHDWTREEDPSAHVECLQVGGVDGLTIRRSSFRRCATHDLFIRSWGGTAGVDDLVIEDNLFEPTLEGYYAMRVSGMSGVTYDGIAVVRNTAAQPLLVDEDAGVNVSFVGNRAPRRAYTCFADQEFRDNAWQGTSCSPSDRDTAATG